MWDGNYNTRGQLETGYFSYSASYEFNIHN